MGLSDGVNARKLNTNVLPKPQICLVLFCFEMAMTIHFVLSSPSIKTKGHGGSPIFQN